MPQDPPKYRYRKTVTDMPGTPLKQRIKNAYPNQQTTLEDRIMKPKAKSVAPKKTVWKSYKSTGPVGGSSGQAKMVQATAGKF